MILGMSIEEKIRESMLGWLQRDHSELDAVEVTTWSEDIPSSWYCETCGPDPVTVTVVYVDSKGGTKSYLYYGYLGEFIEAITRSESRADLT